MIRKVFIGTLLLSGSIAACGWAQATEVSGVWLHQNGRAKIVVAPCDRNLCGTIIWLRDSSGPWRIGQRVFYDMVPDSDDRWRGKAFDVPTQREYVGTMTLAGDRLTTAGCTLWGLICKSIVWSRTQ